jgi:hypothetical protein
VCCQPPRPILTNNTSPSQHSLSSRPSRWQPPPPRHSPLPRRQADPELQPPSLSCVGGPLFPSILPFFLPFCTSSLTLNLPLSPSPEHYSLPKPPLVADQTPSAAAASNGAAVDAQPAGANGPAATGSLLPQSAQPPLVSCCASRSAAHSSHRSPAQCRNGFGPWPF